MRARVGVVLGIFLMSASASYAQQSLVGKYRGEYWERIEDGHRGRPVTQIATLEIATAQDGKVTGKYTLDSNYCRGSYEIQGTFLDNKLELKTSDGPTRDCVGQMLMLQVQGDKLVGNTSAETRERPGLTLTRQ